MIYLDCNATTPLDPEVQQDTWRYLVEEFGNAGSRTHAYGQTAKSRVHQARAEVAAVVNAKPDEIVFTSGATEANNLAILGLAPHLDSKGRCHIVSSQIEHKAVLEPLDHLRTRGFDVTLVRPTAGGWIDPDELRAALRPDTGLVSMMHVNNETAVSQPLDALCEVIADHDAYLHVDAAQGFGKQLEPLHNLRIDLISLSGHKIYAPKGVGALVTRRRAYQRPPLTPLMYGGGQERGLRPGTLPVHLIAALGTAARLAHAHHQQRTSACARFKQQVISAFESLGATVNGDPTRALPNAVNLSMPGLDSEAAILALKGIIAISNGSACTSQRYEPSHVLQAMGLPDDRIRGALRISWSHLTPAVNWNSVHSRLSMII